jgi:hypothetical protein
VTPAEAPRVKLEQAGWTAVRAERNETAPSRTCVEQEGVNTRIVAIWGSGPNDIYGATWSHYIMHFDGKEWSYQDSGTYERLTAIWGTGPNDIYVSVNSNLILHSKGDGKWEHQVYSSAYTFSDIWAADANHVFAVTGGVVRSAGDGVWSYPPERMPEAYGASAMWGSSASDLYALSYYSLIYHSNGDGMWSPQRTDAKELVDIWGTGPADLYAIGYGTIIHSTGDGIWREQPSPRIVADGGNEILQSVWAYDDNAIYVTTTQGRLFRSGGDGRWFAQVIIPKGTTNIWGLWGTSPENLYLGTDLGVYHGTKP